ncbi:MAG: hypothetical protein ABTQ30_15945 [Rhizobiaceae bacterium]
MNDILKIEDITVHNGEPTVQDLRLAEALGYDDRHKIRPLINRNMDELRRYGEVSATVAETSPKGGRPSNEFWLNEAQALLICIKSDAKNAADVRETLIRTFMAWRRGEGFRHGGESLPSFEVDIAYAPLGSKVAFLRMVKKEFGRPAMLHVYRQINLPALPEGIDAVPAGAFQPREALAQLLGHDLDGRPVRHWLSMAFAGSTEATARLLNSGIRIEDDCFAVANTHPAIRAVFQRTKWWPAYPHLRALEGAQTFKPAKYGKGFTSHGTLIPVYWLDPDNLH